MKSPKTHFNFTVKALKDLEPLETRYLCHDTNPKSGGLKLEVMPSGKKVFRLKQKFKGVTKTISIGDFGLITIEQARLKAHAIQNQLQHGIDPNLQKKAARAEKYTLQDVFEMYVNFRAIKPITLLGYKTSMKNVLTPISTKVISEISYDDVKSTYTKYEQISKAEAARAMRLLRALFNYAQEEITKYDGSPLISQNPVKKLFKSRTIKNIERKRSHLEDDQLETVTSFLNELATNPYQYESYRTQADLLLILLFHGTRISETTNIKKDMVDLKYGRFWITSTKNNKNLWLPMTSFTKKVFARRIAFKKESPYLFPSVNDPNKTIYDAKKALHALKSQTGITTTPHDLRRTFMTIGSRLGINSYTLKQLANHSISSSADVTAGYLFQTADELRTPSQRITNFILGKAIDGDQINSMLENLSWQEKQDLIKKLSS